MAIAIKTIPTLRGNDAERFVEAANKAETNSATVNFKKQANIARAILSKAKMC
jgi:hypothetical protein